MRNSSSADKEHSLVGVIRLLRQDPLEEAHAARLVHCGIKQSNIFVTRPGKQADFVKLLDFGLVTRPSDHHTGPAPELRRAGTPACRAPEQVHGRDANARSDIYGSTALPITR
jgi:serine/threonine-protein kinase